MKTFKRALATVAVMGLLLSGCGGSDSEGESTESESSSESSEAPEEEAAEGAFGTDDFSFDAPDGWTDISDQVPNTVIAVGNTENPGEFAANLNVTQVDASGVSDLDDFEAQLEQGVNSVGGTDFEVRDRTEIDGEDAVHISAGAASGGIEYVSEQYGSIVDGTAYIVTISFGTDVAQDERDDVSASILDTWQWAS